jgi:hypothetical protein
MSLVNEIAEKTEKSLLSPETTEIKSSKAWKVLRQ